MTPQSFLDWSQAIAVVAYLLLDFYFKIRRELRDESLVADNRKPAKGGNASNEQSVIDASHGSQYTAPPLSPDSRNPAPTG